MKPLKTNCSVCDRPTLRWRLDNRGRCPTCHRLEMQEDQPLAYIPPEDRPTPFPMPPEPFIVKAGAEETADMIAAQPPKSEAQKVSEFIEELTGQPPEPPTTDYSQPEAPEPPSFDGPSIDTPPDNSGTC